MTMKLTGVYTMYYGFACFDVSSDYIHAIPLERLIKIHFVLTKRIK